MTIGLRTALEELPQTGCGGNVVPIRPRMRRTAVDKPPELGEVGTLQRMLRTTVAARDAEFEARQPNEERVRVYTALIITLCSRLSAYKLRCVMSDKREVAVRWREAWLQYMAAKHDAEAAGYRQMLESESCSGCDSGAKAARNIADERLDAALDKMMRVPALRRDDIATKAKAAGKWRLDRSASWQETLAEDEARHPPKPKAPRRTVESAASN